MLLVVCLAIQVVVVCRVPLVEVAGKGVNYVHRILVRIMQLLLIVKMGIVQQARPMSRVPSV